MAAPEVFIDTSGFYALLVKEDAAHTRAAKWLQEAAGAGVFSVTSDYILDETATLLMARGFSHVIPRFFQQIDGSRALTVQHIDPMRFTQAKEMLLARLDQGISFTDCTSFCLMQELRVRKALTKDEHFQHAGFSALLL